MKETVSEYQIREEVCLLYEDQSERSKTGLVVPRLRILKLVQSGCD